LARLKALYGVEWCLIDYLFLIKDLPGKDDDERTAFISRNLKDIAKDLDIIMLVINSMTKSGQDRKSGPTNTGLRGSGQVSYDADDVWFLTKSKNGNENLRVLTPTKARERDSLSFINILKIPGFPAFADVERKKLPEVPAWLQN